MSYKQQFIWKKSKDLAVIIYKLTKHFPKEEKKAKGKRQKAKGFLLQRFCPKDSNTFHFSFHLLAFSIYK